MTTYQTHIHGPGLAEEAARVVQAPWDKPRTYYLVVEIGADEYCCATLPEARAQAARLLDLGPTPPVMIRRVSEVCYTPATRPSDT